MMTEDTPYFPGTCCACRSAQVPLRNVVMLPVRGPDPGLGWGCCVCGLPTDGALAVVCDICVEAGVEIVDVCAGGVDSGGRLPVSACTEPFAHDPVAHAADEQAMHAPWAGIPDDDDDEDDEHETFICAACGAEAPRPAVVLFAGEGEAMTATELCPACVGASYRVH